jgi:hypothetical protein
MLKFVYAEDAFVNLVNTLMSKGMSLDVILDESDYVPMYDFYNICLAQTALTEKQARFILSLIKKYSGLAYGEDHEVNDKLIFTGLKFIGGVAPKVYTMYSSATVCALLGDEQTNAINKLNIGNGAVLPVADFSWTNASKKGELK